MLDLSHSRKFFEGKIVRAILNPVFQSKNLIIASHICTESQYNAGMIEWDKLLTIFDASILPNG